MGGPASSTTAEIYMQAYERTAITTSLHPLKVWERFVDDVYFTNNHSLPQSQQLTQARDIQEEEIRISINLPYVEGTSEKLRRILRSHKIRSTFYTENTLRKLLCKPKDRIATGDKSNIVYAIELLISLPR